MSFNPDTSDYFELPIADAEFNHKELQEQLRAQGYNIGNPQQRQAAENGNSSLFTMLGSAGKAALATTAWALRPLRAPYSFVAAPMAHNYQSKTFFGQVGEAVSTGVKAATGDVVGKGKEEYYGRTIAEEYLPETAPDWLKDVAGNMLDVTLDPTMWGMGVNGLKFMQNGLRASKRMAAADSLMGEQLGPATQALNELLDLRLVEADPLKMQVQLERKFAAEVKGAEKAGISAVPPGESRVLKSGTFDDTAAQAVDRSAQMRQINQKVMDQLDTYMELYTEARQADAGSKEAWASIGKKLDDPGLEIDASRAIAKEEAELTAHANTVYNVDKEGLTVQPSNAYGPASEAYFKARGERRILNISKAGAPEDVVAYLRQIESEAAEDIKLRSRGKLTDKQVQRMVEKEKKSLSDLVDFPTGYNPNIEEVTALKIAAQDAMGTYVYYADLYAKNPTPANARVMERTQQVLSQIWQARAAGASEWGRAGRGYSWKGTEDALNAMAQHAAESEAVAKIMGDDFGGFLAAGIQSFTAGGASKSKVGRQLGRFIQGINSTVLKTDDVVYNYYVNALLSSPATAIKNVITTTGALVLKPLEDVTKVGLDTAFNTGKGGRVDSLRRSVLDVSSDITGGVEGFVDGIRITRETQKNPHFIPTLKKYNKDLMKNNMVSLAGITKSQNPRNFMNRSIWESAASLVGRTVQIPGRTLTLSDRMFKMMAYRMDLRKKAAQIAHQQLPPGSTYAELKHVQEGLVNKFDVQHGLIRDKIQRAGVVGAEESTFTQPLVGLTAELGKVASTRGIRYVAPFHVVGINLIKYGLRHSPLSLMPYASDFWTSIAKGGEEATAAMSRAVTGAAAAGTVMYMLPDKIEGSSWHRNYMQDMTEAQYGLGKYNLNYGDYTLDLSQLAPLSTIMGTAILARDIMANLYADNPEDVDMLNGIGFRLMEMSIDMTKDTGYSSAFNTMVDIFTKLGHLDYEGLYEDAKFLGQNPLSYTSKTVLGKVAKPIVSNMVPAIVKDVAQMLDPYTKNAAAVPGTWGFLNGIAARTPGLGKDLPGTYNIMGEDVRADAGSPVGTFFHFHKVSDAFKPQIQMIKEVGADIRPTPYRLGGVKLYPVERAIMARETGRRFARQMLMQVHNPTFSGASNFSKKIQIERMHKDATNEAKVFLRDHYPAYDQRVSDRERYDAITLQQGMTGTTGASPRFP